MNFVISNYSSLTQTEPMYMGATLRSIGCKSFLWDPSEASAYDVFDTVKPNYYITHITSIVNDAISYIKENGGVQLIINITNSNQENLSQVEDILKSNNVPIALLFTNEDNTSITSEHRLLNLCFGADIFLSRGNLSYNLDIGHIITSQDQIQDFDRPYHTISYNKSLANDVDIFLPIDQLSNIYSNYDELIFSGFSSVIPQAFYDAIYYGKKVSYYSKDEEDRNLVSSKIKKIFRTDMNICDRDNVNSIELRKKLLDRHTCLHRVKSILSQLPSNEYLSKVDKLIGELS